MAQKNFLKVDKTMLVLVVLLAVFGLTVLLSTSEYNGRVRFGDSAYYFKKQLFATALGMGVMYAVTVMDYHFFLKLAPAAYLKDDIHELPSLTEAYCRSAGRRPGQRPLQTAA